MGEVDKRRAREHGIVLFEDRLIYEAQPPINESVLSQIEAKCAGPLPDALKKLWGEAFGGKLDYALEIQLGGQIVEFSFAELFFPDSDGYRDLWGWIDHEVDLAQQVSNDHGRPFDGVLRYLPIGGFEYTDRLYVCVEPGPEYGSVHAWMQGLPPAWVLRLHDDHVGRVARDIQDLFRQLDLEEDPFGSEGDEFRNGISMAECLDEVAKSDAELADQLQELVKSSVVTWRAAIRDLSFSRSPRATRIAIMNFVMYDDRAGLEQLERLGCSLAQPLRGGGNALDLALAHGHLALADWLLSKGLDAESAVSSGASSSPVGMVLKLLAAGGRPDAIAVRSACLAGLHDSAVAIAAALPSDELRDLINSLDPSKFGGNWAKIEALRNACMAIDQRRH
ncbi:MAG: SMI1/KNR4 family protein [Hyphomonadaceae bacterium]